MLFTFIGCKHVSLLYYSIPCRDIPNEYIKSCNKLEDIYQKDQEDRKKILKLDTKSLDLLAKADFYRREKVLKLFAQGCFKTSDDYKKAALIFQHGNVPDHYYQSFIWSRFALRLGDESARNLVNSSIDRFLIHSGFRQLFGTQAHMPLNADCSCLYPVESSFSDDDRTLRQAKTLYEQIEWLKELNKDNLCPNWECYIDLKPVTQDEFPEFWL